MSRSFGRLNQLGVNIVAVHASMHASSSCCPLSQCNLSHMWLGTLWQSTRAPWCTIARQLPGMLRSLIRSPLLPQLRRLTTAVPAAGTAPPPAGDAVASYSRATSALHWIMGLGIVGCIGTVQVVLCCSRQLPLETGSSALALSSKLGNAMLQRSPHGCAGHHL